MPERLERFPGLNSLPILADEVPPADNWLFCLGLAQNGTTALSRIISAHPRATLLNEVWLWGYASILRTPEFRFENPDQLRIANARLQSMRAASDCDNGTWRASAIRELFEGLRQAVAPDDTIFGDKAGNLYSHLDDLSTVFPHCKLIFSIRSEWDRAALKLERPDWIAWHEQRSQFSPRQFAEMALREARAEVRWVNDVIESRSPHETMIALFDDIAANPEATIKGILDYLELDHDSYDWQIMETLHHSRTKNRWKSFPALAALREEEDAR